MKESKRFEHPIFDVTHGEFTWCLHCETVHKTSDWINNRWDCPERGCDGSPLDAHSWESDAWPMSVNPDYPITPEEGKRYPLYGKSNPL